jgi:DNA-binding transcriptional MerR regulator
MSRQKRVHQVTAVSLTVAPPIFGKPTVTVGEIAQRVQTIGPNPASTIERIRHWTREGLLIPADQHHAGSGKHRRYATESVYDAAILTVIANAGLPLVSQTYLHKALPLARGALRKWIRVRRKNQDIMLFLEISQTASETGSRSVRIHEGAVKHDSSAELSIIINLSQIFTRVVRDHPEAAEPKSFQQTGRFRSHNRPSSTSDEGGITTAVTKNG